MSSAQPINFPPAHFSPPEQRKGHERVAHIRHMFHFSCCREFTRASNYFSNCRLPQLFNKVTQVRQGCPLQGKCIKREPHPRHLRIMAIRAILCILPCLVRSALTGSTRIEDRSYVEGDILIGDRPKSPCWGRNAIFSSWHSAFTL